jgi:hypothetical protein
MGAHRASDSPLEISKNTKGYIYFNMARMRKWRPVNRMWAAGHFSEVLVWILLIFTFGCCILLRMYLTGSLWRRQSQHLHLQHRQHTSHEEETSNNRRKTKSHHCPQLDHHDADGLAGHKTWRTTQTTMRRYKFTIRESAHSSWYFNILYMGPLLYTTSNVEFCWFYNLYFYIQFDNMY